jgi:glycosyltransferase involved in cell wall biosynthesis
VNPGHLPGEEIIDGIIIHRTKRNVGAHLNVPLLIRKLRPEVIVDDMAHVVPWFSPFFTKARVIAFFRHYHAMSLPGQVSRPAAGILSGLERSYPWIYRNSMFVTETSRGKQDLIHLGVPATHIAQIPPGVDAELFRPAKKTVKPSLVYFGGMKEYKRPWLAVETLKMLPTDKGIYLVVVGEGKALERMKEKSVKYDLDDRITFTGHIPDAELARIVAGAWANLHFSVTEGFGLSILEAAAAGTPTVALEALGVSEVVNRLGLGKTIRVLNEIPVALSDVLKDNKNWSEKVNASTKLFSWDRTADMWEDILRRGAKDV